MSRLVKISGMVDPHTHLRDLEWSHKATFASETAAAVAGGYWAVFDMPNTPPSTINRKALDQKLTAINQSAVCDWGVYFGASQSDNTLEYKGIVNDVCGLKIFNNATTGDLLISDQPSRDKHYAAWPEFEDYLGSCRRRNGVGHPDIGAEVSQTHTLFAHQYGTRDSLFTNRKRRRIAHYDRGMSASSVSD